jgi:hypothetical protein
MERRAKDWQRFEEVSLFAGLATHLYFQCIQLYRWTLLLCNTWMAYYLRISLQGAVFSQVLYGKHIAYYHEKSI